MLKILPCQIHLLQSFDLAKNARVLEYSVNNTSIINIMAKSSKYKIRFRGTNRMRLTWRPEIAMGMRYVFISCSDYLHGKDRINSTFPEFVHTAMVILIIFT